MRHLDMLGIDYQRTAKKKGRPRARDKTGIGIFGGAAAARQKRMDKKREDKAAAKKAAIKKSTDNATFLTEVPSVASISTHASSTTASSGSGPGGSGLRGLDADVVIQALSDEGDMLTRLIAKETHTLNEVMDEMIKIRKVLQAQTMAKMNAPRATDVQAKVDKQAQHLENMIVALRKQISTHAIEHDKLRARVDHLRFVRGEGVRELERLKESAAAVRSQRADIVKRTSKSMARRLELEAKTRDAQSRASKAHLEFYAKLRAIGTIPDIGKGPRELQKAMAQRRIQHEKRGASERAAESEGLKKAEEEAKSVINSMSKSTKSMWQGAANTVSLKARQEEVKMFENGFTAMAKHSETSDPMVIAITFNSREAEIRRLTEKHTARENEYREAKRECNEVEAEIARLVDTDATAQREADELVEAVRLRLNKVRDTVAAKKEAHAAAFATLDKCKAGLLKLFTAAGCKSELTDSIVSAAPTHMAKLKSFTAAQMKMRRRAAEAQRTQNADDTALSPKAESTSRDGVKPTEASATDEAAAKAPAASAPRHAPSSASVPAKANAQATPSPGATATAAASRSRTTATAASTNGGPGSAAPRSHDDVAGLTPTLRSPSGMAPSPTPSGATDAADAEAASPSDTPASPKKKIGFSLRDRMLKAAGSFRDNAAADGAAGASSLQAQSPKVATGGAAVHAGAAQGIASGDVMTYLGVIEQRLEEICRGYVHWSAERAKQQELALLSSMFGRGRRGDKKTAGAGTGMSALAAKLGKPASAAGGGGVAASLLLGRARSKSPPGKAGLAGLVGTSGRPAGSPLTGMGRSARTLGSSPDTPQRTVSEDLLKRAATVGTPLVELVSPVAIVPSVHTSKAPKKSKEASPSSTSKKEVDSRAYVPAEEPEDEDAPEVVVQNTKHGKLLVNKPLTHDEIHEQGTTQAAAILREKAKDDAMREREAKQKEREREQRAKERAARRAERRKLRRERAAVDDDGDDTSSTDNDRKPTSPRSRTTSTTVTSSRQSTARSRKTRQKKPKKRQGGETAAASGRRNSGDADVAAGEVLSPRSGGASDGSKSPSHAGHGPGPSASPLAAIEASGAPAASSPQSLSEMLAVASAQVSGTLAASLDGGSPGARSHSPSRRTPSPRKGKSREARTRALKGRQMLGAGMEVDALEMDTHSDSDAELDVDALRGAK